MEPIPEEIVEKTWQEVVSFSPDRAKKEMMKIGNSQPELLAFVTELTKEMDQEAKELRMATEERLGQCKLELHSEKTKIVYCKDDKRRGTYSDEKFNFLGFTFRSRWAKSRWGKYFIGFSPAISNEATKSIRSTVRSWRLHRRSDKSLGDLARMYNPIIRGWINYYGSYYKSALYRVFYPLSRSLMRWAMRKYKKLKPHVQMAAYWLGRIAKREPNLFAHWQMGMRPTAGQ